MTACQCCQRWAPHPRDGSPQKPCPGTAALEEARHWAKVWKARARALQAAEAKRLVAKIEDVIPIDLNESTSTIDQADKVIAKYGAGEALDDLGKVLEESGCKVTITPGVTREEARELAKEWNPVFDAPWTKIARCQNGHNVRDGSPMHDQMLERGCFHCGAYPE